jgi:hypothetical protein
MVKKWSQAISKIISFNTFFLQYDDFIDVFKIFYPILSSAESGWALQ